MKTLIVLIRRHRHWVCSAGALAAGRTNGSMTGSNISPLGWLHAADPSHTPSRKETEAEAIAARGNAYLIAI